MSENFPEPKYFGGKVKVELDLSNYATKTDTLSLVKKADLPNLKSDQINQILIKLKNLPTNLNNFKSKVDKLDVDKLAPVPVDLRKLSDIVKKDT